MKIFTKLFFLVAFFASFTFATGGAATDTFAQEATVMESVKAIKPELKKKQAVWIKLEGDVEPAMYDFCARAIGEALDQKPDYIVFEINTFGGRLDAAFDLVDTIMAVKGPETIALVKKKAISAGSLIALACQKLYMLEATTIGDCAPIVQGGDGTPQIVGEKIQSPLRAKSGIQPNVTTILNSWHPRSSRQNLKCSNSPQRSTRANRPNATQRLSSKAKNSPSSTVPKRSSGVHPKFS